MKHKRLFWLLLSMGSLIAGIALLGVSAVASMGLFILGVGLLIWQSVRWMRVSGGVKENYFERGGSRSVRFAPADPVETTNADIWDTLNGKKGEDA